MVIYLRPGFRRRAIIVASVILVALGVRLAMPVGENQPTAARISLIQQVRTNAPLVGLAVDVTTGTAVEITALMTALEGLGVKATWFVNATLVEANTDLIRQMAILGHEFGVKGTDEKPMNRLSALEIKDRLARSRKALSAASVDAAPFFLPPGGKASDNLVQTAFGEGFHALKPRLSATSMKGKEKEAGEKLSGQATPGDIILMRLEKKGPVPKEVYLQSLATHLLDRGLTVTTLSALVRSIE